MLDPRMVRKGHMKKAQGVEGHCLWGQQLMKKSDDGKSGKVREKNICNKQVSRILLQLYLEAAGKLQQEWSPKLSNNAAK